MRAPPARRMAGATRRGSTVRAELLSRPVISFDAMACYKRTPRRTLHGKHPINDETQLAQTSVDKTLVRVNNNEDAVNEALAKS